MFIQRRRRFSQSAAHTVTGGGGGGYQGPGDIATFTAWGGLRAYSAAAATQNAIRLKANDTTEASFATLANGDLDASTISSWITTHGSPAVVTGLWDQVGNTLLWTGTTTGLTYTASGLNSKPVITGASGGTNAGLASVSNITLNDPYSLYSVANRTGDTTGFNAIIQVNGGSNVNFFGFNSAANQARGRGPTGLAFTPTANDNTGHCLILLLNGASSVMWVDNSSTSGTLNASNPGSAGYQIAAAAGGGSLSLTGQLAEIGFYSGDITSKVASLDSNASTYWGV